MYSYDREIMSTSFMIETDFYAYVYIIKVKKVSFLHPYYL